MKCVNPALILELGNQGQYCLLVVGRVVIKLQLKCEMTVRSLLTASSRVQLAAAKSYGFSKIFLLKSSFFSFFSCG